MTLYRLPVFIVCAICLLSISFFSSWATAANILDQSNTGATEIGFKTIGGGSAPIGQSFTAGMSGPLSVNIDIDGAACALSNQYVFQASLYSGAGNGGAVLASQMITVPLPLPRNLLNITFGTPATVTAGSVYTLYIAELSSQPCSTVPLSSATLRWYFSGNVYAAGTSHAAAATPLTVLNHSFETPVTEPATFTGAINAAPSGWLVYNAGATNTYRYFGVWNPSTTNAFVGGAPDDENVGVVFLLNTTGIAEAGLRQVLSDTLQLLTQYTLTVEVGNFSDVDPGPFDFTGFPGYRVELFAGSTLLAVDNNSLSPGEGIFVTSVVSFTTGASHANAGQPLSIRLVNLNGPGTEVNFDNVRLTALALPVPSTVDHFFQTFISNNPDWDNDGDGIPNGIDANPLNSLINNELVLPVDATHQGARMSGALQISL